MRALDIRGAAGRRNDSPPSLTLPCSSSGPRQARLHRFATRRPVGRRFHLLLDVVGHRLRRLHHRRLLSATGRMESRSIHDASLVVDALNMAAWTRRHTSLDGLMCHTDAGSQYTSIAYTERIDDVGAAPSIGTVGDSYDNAMAESVMGLFKTELHRNPAAISRQRRSLDEAWTTSRSPHAPGSHGSTRSVSTESSTTRPRPRLKPTTVTGLSPMRHEKSKQQSLRQTQADSPRCRGVAAGVAEHRSDTVGTTDLRPTSLSWVTNSSVPWPPWRWPGSPRGEHR